MKSCVQILLAATLLALPVHAFTNLNRNPFVRQLCRFASTEIAFESEYSVGEDEEESSAAVRSEFAALLPGASVQIQVGNMELARKAWKKRRRSGSPLLIPCSVLNADRASVVIGNIVYLVRKFGMPVSEQEITSYKGSKDIALSVQDLSRWYKKHLGTSLLKHAQAFSYESSSEMLYDIISYSVEDEFGIKLHTEGDNIWLISLTSKMRGQRLAAQCAMLQFVVVSDVEMRHTGKTRVRTPEGHYSFQPISAAIRISQRAVDAGIISTGSIENAALFGVDPMGDNGAPLLKLALNTPRRKPRRDNKKKKARAIDVEDSNAVKMTHTLEELNPGSGPFLGRVVGINSKVQNAYIDIGVGRKMKGGKGRTRVLGLLRTNQNVALKSLAKATAKNSHNDRLAGALDAISYDEEDADTADDIDKTSDSNDDWIVNGLEIDALFEEEEEEEEEEIVEDISDLISIKDGVYVFEDPDAGTSTPMGRLNDFADDDITDEEDGEDELFAGLSPEERFGKLEEIMSVADANPATDLEVGDEVEVYIQAVALQSGRFMLTTNPSSKKMKEVKKESKANKAVERLIAKFGGDINNILSLKGTECEGIVKATSQTGDWLYIQPQKDDLPVGIAALAEGINAENLAKGDTVKVRLDGIDESRGQLAMTIIEV